MKSKIIFKNYQKLFILILILVVTLIFGFSNGSFNVIEGLRRYKKKPRNDKATESEHKNAAKKRSKGDGKLSNDENRLVGIDEKLNSG